MEDYPAAYIQHSLPLVFLSGLTADREHSDDDNSQSGKGTIISADRASCRSEQANGLKDQLATWDGTQQPLNSAALPGTAGALRYRFKYVGRTFNLPPRKAAPLAQSPSTESVPLRQGNNDLHSPLSPLSPGSPIYPDGVMSPPWFAKHQSQLPCLVMAFFDFTTDGGAAEDDGIRAAITAMKGAMQRSGYRSRFAVVLISDRSIIQNSELENRVLAIRRATSLDAKHGLFFMPPMPTSAEVATFVQSMLLTLQSVCVEYYRELTKHARRKKSRNAIPQSPIVATFGAAQSLPMPGWNARYELKQAVFAEFRQEMDVAERHYSQALEDLCSADGLFESISNWSPRWNEVRLLCDCLAIRTIRCLLWNGLTTSAAQFWYDYRARIRMIIDSRGKGTHTYGWLAWETRWSRIMAQSIQLAELPMLEVSSKPRTEQTLDTYDFVTYTKADRAFQTVENVSAHILLHHAGYWNRLALKTARQRLRSALAIPDEDRVPPGQSPASSVASRALTYDTYLVPEPHEEYLNALESDVTKDLQLPDMTSEAIQGFSQKGQHRMTELLSLDLAKDLVAMGFDSKAFDILLHVWQHSSWRQERWHSLFDQLLGLLHQCSVAVKDMAVALSTEWESLSIPMSSLGSASDHAAGSHEGETTSLSFENADRLSPVRFSFAFDEIDAHAGESLKCQLLLETIAAADVDTVELSFSNGDTVRIEADDALEFTERIQMVDLQHIDSIPTARASLRLTPDQKCIIQFDIVFQDAGMVVLQQVLLSIRRSRLQVRHKITDMSLTQAPCLFSSFHGHLAQHDLRSEDTTQVTVHPKVPKVAIQLLSLPKQYYVGEMIRLNVNLTNNEAQDISGDLSISVSQPDNVSVPCQFVRSEPGDEDHTSITTMAPATAHSAQISIQAPQIVTVLSVSFTFTYTLHDARETMLIKSHVSSIQLATLLEPKWTFGPLLHPAPWPNYFEIKSEQSRSHPAGIPQRWQTAFTARAAALEDIKIHKAVLQLEREPDEAVCMIEDDDESNITEQDGTIACAFELTTSKIAAEDRRPTQLRLDCHIEWSRKKNSQRHICILSVPRISVLSSEPRVLCTATNVRGALVDVVLDYHIENPSNHFLTFALTMQPSDDFAFKGVKQRTLSLTPLSRYLISYSVTLYDDQRSENEGRWIWPELQVVDAYYQKTLRVQAAGSNVKIDPERGLGVLISRPSKDK